MLPQGYQWQSEIGRTSAAKGRVESRAEDILEFLEARGIEVSDAHRKRVLTCSDLNLLRRWVRRAATIGTADELFAD